MKAEYINPFVRSTVAVFSTMCQCELTRGELSLKTDAHPQHEISGVIGLSGKLAGTVVVSLHEDMALYIAEALLGTRPEHIDDDVTDAVGEMTNMIAGKAKSGLEAYNMSLSLPTVISGSNHKVQFGSHVQPICIPYSSLHGDLTVEVGLVEAPTPVTA